LAAGPTAETFTQENLERTFGGVLRNFELSGHALHKDDDARSLNVITDDERPLVFYGVRKSKKKTNAGKANRERSE
jgi:manganese/iron transport system ATP-binding protein